ncbi:MAG: hypothetical protein QMD96_05610 [Anaerosomatales bacterium]|nr:hypothetical protein [Anaerosomatales bacterium]
MRLCDNEACPLWRHRLGREAKVAPPPMLTRQRAIWAFCLACSGGDRKTARRCLSSTCQLWAYRPGAAA